MVEKRLETIDRALTVIERKCADYGGWAGSDESAKLAVDLGIRLAGLGVAVGVFGREYAESSDR